MADSDIKIRFAVEGDDTLKSALKAIDSEIKALNEGVKASTEALKGMDDQEGNSATKAQQLQSVIDANKQKLALLSTEYDKAKAKLAELAKALEEAKNSGDAAAIDKATKAYNEQSTSVSKLEGEMSKANGAINTAKNEMDLLGDEIEDTSQKTSESSDGFTVLKGVLANLATEAINKVTGALKDMVSFIKDTGMSFDSSMANVKAISGATADEFEALRDKAEEMGAKTKFTATEAADAMGYMAMAGWKADDMLNGIEGVMNLAAASGQDLATTSDIVTDALTAMGYQTSDSTKLADVMAATAANANTNVYMMGESFKYAAPLAGTLGYSMEDVSIALGIMANSGIKASQAGTSLRSIFSNLAAPTDTVQSAMDKLNFSLTNTDGTMKSFREVMIELREKMSGLSETEQTAIAKAIAGKNAMSGFLNIINASDDDFNNLAKAIDNSNGSAEKMKDTMNDTLPGAIVIFNSAVSACAQNVYDNFSGIAKDAIVQLTQYVSQLATTLKEWSSSAQAQETMQRLADAVNRVVAAIGNNLEPIINGIIGALDAFSNGLAFVIANMDSIISLIGIAVTTFMTFKAAMAAIDFIKLIANPVGGIIVSIAGLIAIIVLCVQHWDDIKNGARICWEEIKQVWGKAKEWFSGVVSGIMTALGVFVEGGTKPFRDAWDAIVNAWNGATKFFYDLGYSIVESIAEAITTLPKKAMNWAKDMMEGFGKGITKFMDSVTQPVKDLADKISGFLHFSRPDFGPLRDYESWMPDMVKGLAKSLTSSIPTMERAAESMAGTISGKLGSITASATVGMMSNGNGAGNGVADSIVSALHASGFKGGLTVNQTVNANQTSYAAQQREAAQQMADMARRLGYGV